MCVVDGEGRGSEQGAGEEVGWGGVGYEWC